MAKEEIVLVRNQAFDFGLFNTKQDITVLQTVNHFHAFGAIFVIGEGADVTGLHYDLMLRKLFVQLCHLLGREGHAVVYRGFGFFDDTYFHDMCCLKIDSICLQKSFSTSFKSSWVANHDA